MLITSTGAPAKSEASLTSHDVITTSNGIDKKKKKEINRTSCHRRLIVKITQQPVQLLD